MTSHAKRAVRISATLTVCSRLCCVRFIAAKATSDAVRLSSWKTATSEDWARIRALGKWKPGY